MADHGNTASYSIISVIATQSHNHQNDVPREYVCFGQLIIYRMAFVLKTNDIPSQSMRMIKIWTLRTLLYLHFYSYKKGILLFYVIV